MADTDSTKTTEDPNFKGGVMSPNSKQTFAQMRLNPPIITKNRLVLDEDSFEMTFLKCSMCRERFNLSEKSPRLLPCHHSFCMACMMKFYQAELAFRNNAMVASSFTVAVSIICPTCKASFISSLEGIKELPIDHRVVQLIDFVGSTEKFEADFCPKHTMQCLNFFCEECVQPLCRDCTVLDHKDCAAAQHVLDIKTAQAKYTPVVEKGITDMEEEMKSLKEKREECEKALTECQEGDQTVINEIKESFEKIRKALNDRENELLELAKSQTGTGKEAIDEKIKNINEKETEVGEILKTLQASKGNDSLLQLFTNYEKLSKYETEPALEKETSSKDQTKTAKFTGRDEITVLSRVSKFGEVEVKDSSSSGYGGVGSYSSYSSSNGYGSSSRYTGSSYSSRYTPSRTSYRY